MNKNLLFFAVLIVLNYQCTECWKYPQYNLEKLLQFGRTSWNNARALVRRAVDGDVTDGKTDDKGGTKLPFLLNATGNATNFKPNNSKKCQTSLNVAREREVIPVKKQDNEILQRIQAATDKIVTLLKLFNVSDNENGNVHAVTTQGVTSSHTSSATTNGTPTTVNVPPTTEQPYPGAYMGYNPIIDIINGTHKINNSGRSKRTIRRRRSLRRRYLSESMRRKIRRLQKSKQHRRNPHHKPHKPKQNIVLSKNSSVSNTMHNMKEGLSGDANVLKVLWSMQKMIHRLGRVLTMNVHKLGNQAVDNTNEERADIRSNSDRISQMQVGLSGNINDIRYNISNLISSQKQLGKSVSVALENMMKTLNQMVGMITRRDEQIEEIGKIKSLGINITNPESILDFLRSASIHRNKSVNETKLGSSHIKLPKNSYNVSNEVKIIRSKEPAKKVNLTSEQQKEGNNITNTVSPTGNTTTTTGTSLNILNISKEQNKSHKSFKNGNKTVKTVGTFDRKPHLNHTVHNKHQKNGTKITHGNITTLNRHRKHGHRQEHKIANTKQRNKTAAIKHKKHKSKISHGYVTTGDRHRKHGHKVAHKKHRSKNAIGVKSVKKKKKVLRTKHNKHKHQYRGNVGKKVIMKRIKPYSNNVKVKGNNKHPSKKGGKSGEEHKKKQNKILVTNSSIKVQLPGNTQRSHNVTTSIGNKSPSFTTTPVTKQTLNETVSSSTIKPNVAVQQSSQNQSTVSSNSSEPTTVTKGSNFNQTNPKNTTNPSTAPANHPTTSSIVVTKSPPNQTFVTEPSKIQTDSGNTTQHVTISRTSHSKMKSGNSSRLGKILSGSKNALNISTPVQKTHLPTEKGDVSIGFVGKINNNGGKHPTEKKKGHKLSHKKDGVNKREQVKNTPKTDKIKTKNQTYRHINSSMNTLNHHRNQNNANISKFHNDHSILNKFKNIKHITAKKGQNIHTGKTEKRGQQIYKRINENNGKNIHSFNGTKGRNIYARPVSKKGQNNHKGFAAKKRQKINIGKVSKKTQNIYKGINAKKEHNIHKGVLTKKGHTIHKGIFTKKGHNIHKGILSKKGHSVHKGILSKKGHNIHKGKFMKKGHNIHKGILTKKGHNIHKGILTKKGHNIHKGILTKRGHNIYKGILTKKGHNIHKGKFMKKGHNIHKGILTKKGHNIHKGILTKKRHNIHKGKFIKKGHNIHKGILTKKGQSIHKGILTKKGHTSNRHNIQKGILTKKGHNIHKGKFTKKGRNIHKGKLTKKGRNIHKGKLPKKGRNIHKGVASAKTRHYVNNAKRRQNMHKHRKNKFHHGNLHHGKKQVHRLTKSLNSIY